MHVCVGDVSEIYNTYVCVPVHCGYFKLIYSIITIITVTAVCTSVIKGKFVALLYNM